jgi:hypothetical protein
LGPEEQEEQSLIANVSAVRQVASEVKIARTPGTERCATNPAALQTPKIHNPFGSKAMGSIRWFLRVIEAVAGLLDDHTAPTNNWSCLTRWVLAGSIETHFSAFLTGIYFSIPLVKSPSHKLHSRWLCTCAVSTLMRPFIYARYC